MEKYLQQTKSDCIKVVLFGPESTGKSTLAKELADHFKTDFVEDDQVNVETEQLIIEVSFNESSSESESDSD